MKAGNSITQAMAQEVLRLAWLSWRSAGGLRRRFRNIANAFNGGEVGYHLAISRYGRFTVAYRGGTADEDVLDDSFDNDMFFLRIPEYKPQPDDVIIDVGAHIGTFSLLAATNVPNGKVFAIEASKETYNYLCINSALNNDLNIVPVHLALADAPGTAVLHHDHGNWGHSIMKQLSIYGERVIKNSFENFCIEYGIFQVGLIKFNCEGAEFPILLNTPVEFLRRVRMMLVLYHSDLAAGYTIESLLGHLHAAGFATDIRNKEGQRGCIVASRA